MIVQSSAPGKLVLLGEYAVLRGAPSLVMAVNRRARVRIQASRDREYHVDAPGFLESTRHLRAQDGGPFQQAPDLGILDHAWRALPALRESGAFSLELDTREFFHPGKTGVTKLGLGSSAALSVALLGALAAWTDSDQPELSDLIAFHRRFQSGRGSGIDVAASFSGGVLQYQFNPEDNRARSHPISLPSGLHLGFFFTGRSAKTTDFLQSLEQRKEEPALDGILDKLSLLSAEGLQDVESQRISAFLQIIDSYASAMQELGKVLGLPVISREHLELLKLARIMGLAYKPSGAGGGDFGLAASDSPERIEDFRLRAQSLGYVSPALRIDAEGIRIKGSPGA